MELIPETADLQKYLECTSLTDFDSESVRLLADSLGLDKLSDIEKVRKVFEYMQASVPHTFNTDRKDVARSASDVVRLGHGICYAKANLAAALLRSAGVPVGFCYQRYRMDDTPNSKFVVHCLNAVYLKDDRRWARVDFRNVAEGYDPSFKPGEDSGIVPTDAAMGELDYPVAYACPHPATIEALTGSRDAAELRENLPQGL